MDKKTKKPMIRRKSYVRKSYNQKDGKVHYIKVKSSLIEDKGKKVKEKNYLK